MDGLLNHAYYLFIHKFSVNNHGNLYVQRKNGWLVQIRRKGHETICRTFNTKSEGERWALNVESGMGVGTYVDNRETLSTSLFECLARYAVEIVPLKKGAARDLSGSR